MIDKAKYTGILRENEKNIFLECADGSRMFENEPIWSGYLTHWKNKVVNARRLEQTDYEHSKPIIIIWPIEPKYEQPFIQIYYNERLVKYFDSLMGHLAINVNGKIFNFAKKINENEIISWEEYFYRPALGEFAPSPIDNKQNITDPEKPYYDKFGRNFMRGIHVLHIEGMDTDKLNNILQAEQDIIHNTPENHKDPGNYPDFNFLNRSCTTIVRDGLNKYGFSKIKGIIPRDFFINAAYNLKKEKDLNVRLFKMPQLVVPECPPSKPTVLFNIFNWYRIKTLKFEN